LLPELSPVVAAPRFIAGVLNFRGRVIAAMDLAVRLGFGARNFQLTDSVIVLEREERRLGVVVDAVLDVIEINDDQIETAPYSLPAAPGGQAPAGRVAKLDSEIITLLDVEELLSFTGELSVQELAELPVDEEIAPDPPVTAADQALFRERAQRLAQVPEERGIGELVPLAVISLNEECFGVSLETVREFADARQITPVPCCPEHVVGAVNLRGEILTLVDVRRALQLPVPAEPRGCKMMVVQVGQLRAGVMVDAVLDVVHLEDTSATPVPYSVKSPVEEHVSGMAPYAGKMLAILDLPGIFAREDWIVNVEA